MKAFQSDWTADLEGTFTRHLLHSEKVRPMHSSVVSSPPQHGVDKGIWLPKLYLPVLLLPTSKGTKEGEINTAYAVPMFPRPVGSNRNIHEGWLFYDILPLAHFDVTWFRVIMWFSLNPAESKSEDSEKFRFDWLIYYTEHLLNE